MHAICNSIEKKIQKFKMLKKQYFQIKIIISMMGFNVIWNSRDTVTCKNFILNFHHPEISNIVT